MMGWTGRRIYCTRTDSASLILFAHLQKCFSRHSGDPESDDIEERLTCSFS